VKKAAPIPAAAATPSVVGTRLDVSYNNAQLQNEKSTFHQRYNTTLIPAIPPYNKPSQLEKVTWTAWKNETAWHSQP